MARYSVPPETTEVAGNHWNEVRDAGGLYAFSANRAYAHRIVDAMDKAELLDEMRAALEELVRSIEIRWEHETKRKRENNVSPRTEAALIQTRAILAKTEGQ